MCNMEQLFHFFDQFSRLDAKNKNAISVICSQTTLKKNAVLQPFGHTCKTIYFIQSGVARIYYLKDGIDITESFAFEGGIIARVESLFTGKPSQKAIQVLEDTEIIALDAPRLFTLYDQYPPIERLFRLIFEKGYVDTVHRMESIQFHNAEERYRALLKETNIIQKIPLKHIASYLGITQVSLSRIRAAIR